MKKTIFFLQWGAFVILLSATQSFDTPIEIPLWVKGAPGSEGKTLKEAVRIADNGDHVVSSIHIPSITVYIPSSDKATGAAIIIAPGGGHRELWIDHEGHNPARWFQERGIAAFVLKYRLAREPNSSYTIDDHALADMQRAIRYVRSRAREWRVDPHRVGVMGFSAGGEVAALSAMRFDTGKANAVDTIDRQPCRPDFQALVYPGNSARYEVNKDLPPAFIVCGYNDRPDIAVGMAQVYQKYKEAGVPVELHIYAKAGHGFGFRGNTTEAVSGWPSRLHEWLTDMGFLGKKKV